MSKKLIKQQPKPLFEFWKDVATRENVQLYLTEYLGQEAAKRLLAGEEVKGIAEAKEFIDAAFDNMDYLFSAKKEPKEVKNPAR